MAKKPDYRKRSQDQIFRLLISLPGTEPLVWRRILVPGLFTLEALNSVIQLTMGWQMKHLYDFQIGPDRYSEPDDFDEVEAKSPVMTISSAVSEHKSFSYTYDFGDDWRHRIEVEEIFPRDELFGYPLCIGGENACPPEDCHGVPGYADLKATISDPLSPEYKDTIRWLGGYFDPTSFDANRINRDLLCMTDWENGPNDQGLYHPFKC